MTCKTAEKLILLQDSGELTGDRCDALITHLGACGECRDYKLSLLESKLAIPTMEEPDAVIVKNILREARIMAPRKKRIRLIGLRPALTMAASVAIALGFFFSSFGPGKVGMEIEVSETQLMESSDQIVDVMYSGLSEDDLAFNFLLTFEEG